jgi:hypothetical protein
VCVVLAALWFVSGWFYLAVSWAPHERVRGIYVVDGSFNFISGAPVEEFPPQLQGGFYAMRRFSPQPIWHWGFDRNSIRSPLSYASQISIPIWVPFTIAGTVTGLLWWRRRPPLRGHCRSCDYDLSGLAQGCECPECGTPAPAVEAVAS